MESKRRYSRRAGLNLEELMEDGNSFLSWGLSDKTLEKLETYRLYKAGHAVSDIAEAFGLSREYLYKLWKGLEEEGTESLVDKRWGSAPRKVTEEKERDILRAKALEPELGDSELGRRYGVDRSTVYRLLKEHGMQDLHVVLCGDESESEEGVKKKVEEEEVEVVSSENAMYLTLCKPLEETKYQESLSCLSVCGEGDRYGDEKLRTALVSLLASGVKRISHINHEPKGSWGVVLDHSRRPDGDTLDRYLESLIELDEEEREAGEADVAGRWGCIRERGRIAEAQKSSLRNWAEAGLLEDEVWRFDGHTIEYYGEGDVGKTKHGTKAKSVKAVDRYTLYNGICGLTDYFPTSISYDEALRRMLVKAQEALPEGYRIRKLSFDKEGWKRETLLWLWEEHQVAALVWVKNTSTNVKILNQIEDEAFVRVPEQFLIGKAKKTQVVRVADTKVELPELGLSRVVVLESTQAKRIAIYTAAPSPQDASLHDSQAISTIQLLDAMRLQQHVENSFKVDVHEMGADALPMHKLLTVQQAEPFPLDEAQTKLDNAHKLVDKYDRQLQEHIPDIQEHSQLGKGDINILNKRANRLHQQALDKVDTLSQEIEATFIDDTGQPLQLGTKQFLDLRKLTLLNLFKAHAWVALIMLAQLLGWNGAGPQRLRQAFLSFGHRVEFDHRLRIATVYPTEFPSARTQAAYETLCAQLHDIPLTLKRQGIDYQLRFHWDTSNYQNVIS